MLKEQNNVPQDEGLKGNEKIENAIAALQKEATEELLAHTLTVIRRRMREHGQLIIAVEPSIATDQIKLKTIQTSDGNLWWMAFTSFDEEIKGSTQVMSTFLVETDKLFLNALNVDEIKGIIINPWNRTIMLDKHLIRIILGEKNYQK